MTKLRLVEDTFDDIDVMAASALEWNEHYEQIGRGRFRGQFTQLLLERLQLVRVQWSPGVLQRGTAPKDTWIFGLPLKTTGSLHVRRRPAQDGELLAATSRDDIGFTATGPTELMVVVLPNKLIRRWMQVRRGSSGIDPDLQPRHWSVSRTEMARRSIALSVLLDEFTGQSKVEATAGLVKHLESRISDTILDMIPSAETIEPLHTRARVARAVLRVAYDHLDNPPSVTELCDLVGVRERTLYLSCLEAFGRPPAHLLLELRLNAAHRALIHPERKTTVTKAASDFGFTHFGRFSAMYAQQFRELPSATLAKSLGFNRSSQTIHL